jgi:transcription initiation factor IIF auxiliary subunit
MKLQDNEGELSKVGASFRKTGTESPNIEKLEADMEKLRTDVELQTLKNDELVMQLQEREDEIQTVGNTATDSRADIERLEADRENLQTLEVSR